MSGELCSLPRPAGPGEIGRTCHQVKAHRPDRTHDQGLTERRRNAQGEVEALVDEIDDAARQIDIQTDLGIQRLIVRQYADEPRRPQPYRNTHFQHTARHHRRIRHHRLHPFQILEHAARMLEIGHSRLGQAQVPAGPIEQPCAEPLLELHDMFAGRGRRDVQALRGAREALELHDRAKHLDAEQSIHESSLDRTHCIHRKAVYHRTRDD